MATASRPPSDAVVAALLACRRTLDRRKAHDAAAHVDQALCAIRRDAEKAR